MIYHGQTEVARWLGVSTPTINMWMNRYDDYPQPDVTIISGKKIYRGWAEDRRKEWEEFAGYKELQDA